MNHHDNNLIDAVCNHIATHAPGQPILIGLSGGVDSMVLLDLCSRSRDALEKEVNFLAVHVNHGLSQEANDWEETCAEVSYHYGIPFVSERLDLDPSMPNLESRARDERYKCFAKHSNGVQSPTVLLAHHQDDVAETFMLNLARGSGIAGLASMSEIGYSHGLKKVRPLLSFGKSLLIRYAEKNGLVWVTDPSNFSSQFDRNYLRNEVLPMLEQRWPSFSQSVRRSVAHLQEDSLLISEVAKEKLQECLPHGKSLPHVIKNLDSVDERWQARVTIEWLRMNGCHYYRKSQVDGIVRMARSSSKSGNDCIEINGVLFKKCRDHIVLWKPDSIFAFLCSLLPHGNKIKLSDIEIHSKKHLKKLKGIAPKSSWDLLPTLWKGDDSFLIADISGRLHYINQTDTLKVKS